MSYQRLRQTAACHCGTSYFKVDGVPIGRFICHCRICQALYKQPYADVVMLWGGAIELPQTRPFTFKKHRLPPALNRSSCNACGAPVVNFMWMAPFVRLAFTNSANFADQSALPPPSFHIFYHRRVKDVHDSLPKVSGYWSSELSVMKLLVGGGARQPAFTL